MGINKSVQFFKRNRGGHIRMFMTARFRYKAGIRSVQGWYVNIHTTLHRRFKKPPRSTVGAAAIRKDMLNGVCT